ETAAGVAFYTVSAVENDMESNAILIQGPHARDACAFPPGGAGGGDACCGPDGCVAQFLGGG
ncbi:MAG: hypothetical protein LLG93_00140, partial [Deltaproteobacteria bacterium]|nr:hypothetical protein [Deltaproteobacteria bacterium]